MQLGMISQSGKEAVMRSRRSKEAEKRSVEDPARIS